MSDGKGEDSTSCGKGSQRFYAIREHSIKIATHEECRKKTGAEVENKKTRTRPLNVVHC